MSQVPTLLKAGSLKSPPGFEDAVPIEYIVTWIKKNMPEFGGHGAELANRVLVVLSKTGTGKSTVLPVYLFRILRSEKTSINVPYKGPSVLCTQPRVLTAIDIASNQIAGASYLPDMRLGVTVGYSTGSFTDKPPAGLVFATIGVLDAQLRTMEDSEIMSLYRFIIIDEAHERSIASDSTLMRLKNFYDRNIGNKKLPFLLLASATFDTELYARYFGVGKENIVSVEGRAFPIYDHFSDAGTNNFPRDSAQKAIQLHEANRDDTPDKADILVFMPGAQEIKLARDVLEQKVKQYADGKHEQFLLLSIDRDAIQEESQDFHLITRDPSKLPLVNGRKPQRRIILSTVVSETGLTLNSLKYVIDNGWNRENVSYQPQGIGGLITLPAPQSRILQRKGRAGRKFPGEFHPVYTENVFNALLSQQLPEVITSGMNDLIIGLISEQQTQKQRVGKKPEFLVGDIEMLGSPPASAVLSALATAHALGFVSRSARLPDGAAGFGLTEFGNIAARFSRTSMEKIRMILAGRVWGASMIDLVTIAAVMESPVRKRLMVMMKPGKDADQKYYKVIDDAFPAFLHTIIGGNAASNLPPTELEIAYMRIRLLVADEFIEALLVVDKFIDRLDRSDGDIQNVMEINEELGLNTSALFEVLAKRDEIIEDLFIAGVFPFGEDLRLSTTKVTNFTERVIAIKRCLYDGFRGKVLTYDEKENAYYDRLGTRAEVPSLLTDLEMKKLAQVAKAPRLTKPKYILTNLLELAKAPKDNYGNTPMVYSIKTRMVSVLDGYIDVDPEFVEPQQVGTETKDVFTDANPRSLLKSYLQICRATSPKCPPVMLAESDALYFGRRRIELVTNAFTDCK